MRLVFFLLALAAAGYAGYLQFNTPSNYASYSEEKLVQLEAAYDQAVLSTKGEAQDTTRVAQLMLQRELTRRLHVKLSLGAAGVCAALALALTLLGGRRGSSDESSQAYDPSPSAREAPAGTAPMTREQAAALLGVQPNAPRAVVEAALHAQLAEREPSQLVGLDPTLKHNVLQQREELMQAGNILLGRQELAFKTEPPRD